MLDENIVRRVNNENWWKQNQEVSIKNTDNQKFVEQNQI